MSYPIRTRIYDELAINLTFPSGHVENDGYQYCSFKNLHATPNQTPLKCRHHEKMRPSLVTVTIGRPLMMMATRLHFHLLFEIIQLLCQQTIVVLPKVTRFVP